MKAKSAKFQGVRAPARARAPFPPPFCYDFHSSIPSPFSVPFENKKITVPKFKRPQVFPRKLFDYTQSSLSSTKNFALIKQKYSPIKQDIFSHKTQKTSETIQKISHVFQKKSDVFLRISHVLRTFLDKKVKLAR